MKLLLVAVACSTAVIVAAAHSWYPNALLLGTTVLLLVLLKFARTKSVLLLVAGAALCQVPGLTHAPITSTDAYRYVWDGRVQLSGSSPYSHVPLDDALAKLRDPILFPGLTPQDRTGITAPPTADASVDDDPRTRINRPQVPTIYPPVAQAYFTVVALVTPWSAGTLGLQLAAALVAVGLTWLLAVELKRRGRDPRWAALWGWSPIVALEASSAAHVDVLAALLIIAALTRRRAWLLGLLLGAAGAVKLLPLLLLPAIPRLRPKFVAVGTFLASYVPHLLVAGTLVAGFLPGYLNQEGFSDGSSRFAILALVLPPDARQLVAGVLAVGLALLALRRHGREPVAVTCCWLYGAALLVATPTYPWYGLPLIALAVLAGRIEWVAVPLAAYWAYASYGHDLRQGLVQLAALLIVVAAITLRHYPSAFSRLISGRAARTLIRAP
ncbi:glycosyltransferase 87 family protein [Kribbella sp. DT2]|uniref:glycosyltransferase 87 family protein n=1 Tax=Kribbella sp. DT2 TaxID=3393427 RepID=UPI003CF6CB85